MSVPLTMDEIEQRNLKTVKRGEIDATEVGNVSRSCGRDNAPVKESTDKTNH